MTSLKDSKFVSRGLEWPSHLRTPNELVQALHLETKLRIIRSPLCSKLVLQVVGGLSYLLANLLNKTHIYNWNVFKDELVRIEEINKDKNLPFNEQLDQSVGDNSTHKRPLITLSNHISCIDDPVLWGALLPFNYYFRKTDTVRWSAAAVDICFSKPWHSAFFSLGKTFPIMRGVGLEQPAMVYASALLKHNEWLHMFPEGRVMRDHNQQKISNKERGYIFKWGLAKLILDYFKGSNYSESREINSEIRILPFYHLGMDKVLPIGRPYIPRFGHKMTIYIRPSVIRMNSKLLDNIISTRTLSSSAGQSRSDDEIMRIKLTNYIEEELEKLIEPATKLHERD